MQADKNEYEVLSSKRGKREGVIPHPVSNEHDTRAKEPFMLFLQNSMYKLYRSSPIHDAMMQLLNVLLFSYGDVVVIHVLFYGVLIHDLVFSPDHDAMERVF